MTTACIVFILWAFSARGESPLDTYVNLEECQRVAAKMATIARDKGQDDKSFSCFPHTFDPRERGAK